MAVRSRRVVTLDSLDHGATTTVYTVPAGRTLVLHSVVVANRSTAARRFIVAVRSGGVSASLGRAPAVPADTAWSPPGAPWVLNPGDELQVFSSGETSSALVSVFASGSLLEGEPE